MNILFGLAIIVLIMITVYVRKMLLLAAAFSIIGIVMLQIVSSLGSAKDYFIMISYGIILAGIVAFWWKGSGRISHIFKRGKNSNIPSVDAKYEEVKK